MRHRISRRAAAVVLGMLWSSSAFATDHYMATTGADIGSCTATYPCLTLRYAFTQMKGGDTLYIADGTYSGAGNLIWSSNYPPSGSAAGYTTIRAANIPGEDGLPMDQPLRVKFTDCGPAPSNSCFWDQSAADPSAPAVSYVKFWGIRWNGSIQTNSKYYHNYFKQVAVEGTLDGNDAAFDIYGTYNLLEDCVAFGKNRYKFMFYHPPPGDNNANNVCRRCVARHDWANKNTLHANPIAGISMYYTGGNAIQNSIVIDSDLPAYWQDIPYQSEIGGAFYQPTAGSNNEVTGSISLNNAFIFGSYNSAGNSISIRDCIGVKIAGGISAPQPNAKVERVSLYNVGVQNFAYRSKAQSSGAVLVIPNVGIYGAGASGMTVTDSLIMGVQAHPSDTWTPEKGYALAVVPGGNNIATYGNASGLLSSPTFTKVIPGPHTASFKYPVEIQPGSPLAKAGITGGQIGASILNRLGADGAFKGDPNWNVSQGPLWPWPKEEWVQAEMRSMDPQIYSTGKDTDGYALAAPYDVPHYDAMPDPNRGFCAAGQTLTKYIWQFLGNRLPAGVYISNK